MQSLTSQVAQADPLVDEVVAAEYIGGMTPAFLQTDRRTGRHGIPFVRVGRHIRYRKSALDAWLLSRTVTLQAA